MSTGITDVEWLELSDELARLQARVANAEADYDALLIRSLRRSRLLHEAEEALNERCMCPDLCAAILTELGDEPGPRTVAEAIYEAIYGSENGR